MVENILKGVWWGWGYTGMERTNDVMILTTWGWVGDGNAVWLATSSHVTCRLAAVTSPWLLVVVVVVVGVGGGGGVGRAAVAARAPRGWPHSLRACLPWHNLRPCLFLHIHASHGSFSICECYRFFLISIIQLWISVLYLVFMSAI